MIFKITSDNNLSTQDDKNKNNKDVSEDTCNTCSGYSSKSIENLSIIIKLTKSKKTILTKFKK